ncbi:hypothetical protein LTR37_001320 [Vermiconidia calcicola]|uniref:Uncharacterized protein n=1 Tax=Vermiconidia calcicola TaxID=1690605 RepID=A0ACC3NWG5_9PEZI|nr:hypothetical protein LTR37_001320 [Vermiconidia calcicola]
MTVSNSMKSKFNKLTTEQMATGGVANVLYQGIAHFPHSKLFFARSHLTVPYRFPGLYSIGCIFFLFNICLFIFNITMISLRFRYYPSTFVASILHPTESLFVPAWLISLGTILINITQYGTTIGRAGEWLLDTMFVLFWVYCVLAIVFSCGILIGPHAGVLSAHISTPRALEIIIAGWTFQGIGFLVSLMIYASFIYRLMTQKLPRESLRPGMFISVGPSGFTIAGVVTMGQVLPSVVPDDFMGNGYLTGQVCKIPNKAPADGRMPALTTATFAIGRALDNVPIKVFGCVLACLLVIAWFTVFSIMIRAVIMKDILWPQKQEDREEGGWRTNPDEKVACDTWRCDDEDVSAAAMRGQTLDVEHPDYEGPSEPRDTRQSTETTLPAIAETLVDESVRGRGVKQDDSMV